jgi:hypothetical protein
MQDKFVDLRNALLVISGRLHDRAQRHPLRAEGVSVLDLRFETQDVQERCADFQPTGFRQRRDPRPKVSAFDNPDPFRFHDARPWQAVSLR